VTYVSVPTNENHNGMGSNLKTVVYILTCCYDYGSGVVEVHLH
jgi:hypothetical protein